MKAAVAQLVRDLRAGAAAPARPLILGALGALAFSAPLIVGLGLWIGPGPAVAMGTVVQLAAGYVLAGRVLRAG
jgi:hypothetical protein